MSTQQQEHKEEEVECVECSTIVPSSEAELTGTEGWGICDNCIDHDEEEEEKEWTEYEVESGYMIDDETGGESYSERYDNKEEAKAEYDRLVNGREYDYVDLVERTMEGEDCMCSDNIKEWKK